MEPYSILELPFPLKNGNHKAEKFVLDKPFKHAGGIIPSGVLVALSRSPSSIIVFWEEDEIFSTLEQKIKK